MKYITNRFIHVNVSGRDNDTFVPGQTTMEDWKVAKARLKEKFSKLIGDELQAMDDEQSEVIARLEKRLGKTRAAILKLISEL